MNRDLVTFGLVGAVSTAIDFIVLNSLTYLGLTIFIAISIAYFIGAVNGYLLNNNWTYGHLNRATTLSGFTKYVSISFIGLGLTELIVYVFYHFLHFPLNIDKLIAVAVVFSWNFVANRFFTFKN